MILVTVIAIYLVMIAFVVYIFEHIYAWLIFQDFKFWRISLEVGLTTPDYISVMFKFVWPIILSVRSIV